jgi:hypothetical protein
MGFLPVILMGAYRCNLNKLALYVDRYVSQSKRVRVRVRVGVRVRVSHAPTP